jgi:molecular chaperone HscB
MNINYFKLFDLEQKYDIDFERLRSQYFKQMTIYHPDAARLEQERLKCLEMSYQLNEGYKILKDDLLRAEHLLRLAGQKLDDQELKSKLSPRELEEIVAEHEELESKELLDDLINFHVAKVEKKDKIIAELSECFKKNNIPKALELSICLKYLTNLVRNIEVKIQYANSRDQ